MSGSIIGDAALSIPTGGRIRPGIKVLTLAAKKNPEAVRIYTEALAKGETFDKIDALIKENTDIARPLTPRNTPFFVARPADFQPQSLAKRLFDTYATVREDSEHKRLYEFPVRLLFEDWSRNMPHSLAAHSRSGVQFWSQYNDGQRYCMTHSVVEVDKRAKRGQKVFGGRASMHNPAMAGGLCEPNQCDLYQDGRCKLSGRLLFIVPGIDSGTVFDVTSTSFYSMSQWRAEMAKIFAIRRFISGLHEGDPIFWLTKAQREISRVVDGKPTKTKQWLSVLETRIDLERLAAPAHAQLSHDPAAALEGSVDDYGEEAPPAGEDLEDGF